MSEDIKIMAEPQANPYECKFTLEKPIVSEGSFRFTQKDETNGSFLADVLLAIENVDTVFISANTITITKKTDADWRVLGKDIGAAIRQALASDKEIISAATIAGLPSEDEVKQVVEKVLKEQINPAVASHGGVIELLDVKKNDIYVRMGGGCQGCGMSNATLKQGVSEAIRKELPTIGAIYDTTDHAAGTNPYYSS